MTAPTRTTVPQATWRTRNVMGASFASLFSDFGHEMITALLPAFLVVLGAPAIALGTIEAVSNAAQSGAEVWAGREADRVSDRARLINIGYAATAFKAAIALVPSWGWIVPIRTVAWLGRGIRGPLRDALIADDVPREAWGKAYGFREALDTAGAFLGPLTVALLVSRVSVRSLIGLSLIPALIASAIVLLTIREVPHRLARGPLELRRPTAFTASYRRFLAVATIFSIGYLAPTFFVLRAIGLLAPGHGAAATGLAIGLYTLHNALYAAVAFPAGLLADRVSPRHLLRIGYGVWVVALLMFAAGPTSVLVLAVPFVLSGTATAIVEPVQTTFAAQLLSPDSRGSGLGLISGFTGLGQLVSGLAVGAIWTARSAPPAFIASAFLAAVSILALQFVVPPDGATDRS